MMKEEIYLYINQGNLSFKEQAKEYGLADDGYSMQAVSLIWIMIMILTYTLPAGRITFILDCQEWFRAKKILR